MNLSTQAVSVYYFQTFQVIWQTRYDKHRLDDATAWILRRSIAFYSSHCIETLEWQNYL